jgi:hypothetical protein
VGKHFAFRSVGERQALWYGHGRLQNGLTDTPCFHLFIKFLCYFLII